MLALDAARRALETRLQEDAGDAATGCRARSASAPAQGDEAARPSCWPRWRALKERREAGRGARCASCRRGSTRCWPTFPNVLADDVPDGAGRDRTTSSCGAGASRAASTSRPLPARRARRRARAWTSRRAAKLSRRALRRAVGPARPARAGARPASCSTCRPASTATPRSRCPIWSATRRCSAPASCRSSRDDLFRTTTDHWLIPTAEVPLTNLVAGEILDEAAAAAAAHRLHALLPLRGRCRRQGHQGHDPPAPVQQGRAGQHHHARAVRGRARAHDRLRRGGAAAAGAALPGDGAVPPATPASRARKTYDLEVWLPGQGALPRDLQLLELRRLPGPAHERPLPAEGRASGPASCTPSTAPAWRSAGR